MTEQELKELLQSISERSLVGAWEEKISLLEKKLEESTLELQKRGEQYKMQETFLLEKYSEEKRVFQKKLEEREGEIHQYKEEMALLKAALEEKEKRCALFEEEREELISQLAKALTEFHHEKTGHSGH